jgi:chromodomain-helicase-DNA-binding protein 1
VDVLGENVNARELIRRCDEMELLGRLISQSKTVDTQFRPRMHIKAPTYTVAWKPKHDAMLLVGINRHGFGNWSRIAEDEDLQLDGKVNLTGSDDNKGAPDSTKLVRRATALLRELSNGESASSEKKAAAKKKSIKSVKSAKTSDREKIKNKYKDKVKPGKLDTGGKAHHERGTKRERTDIRMAPGSRKRPRTKDKWPASSVVMRSAMTEKLKSSHHDTLKELRKLSRDDSKVEPGEKIMRTKECLMDLGSQITTLAAGNDPVHTELWTYVHQSCRTNLPGERLGAIYLKLAENHQRKEQASASVTGGR